MSSLRACDEVRWAALALLGLLLCTADGRVLTGAGATSDSTGGTATSVSQALGDSEIITAAIAKNGGDATAMQSADSGKHTQVTVTDGTNSNTWTTSMDDGKPPSWNDVPACKTSPSRTNSVKDVSGRLWGYEANTSCAYKDPKDHHPVFYWEAAPACPGSPGADSVTDSQGRVWGWAHGVSCAYKPSFHRKLTTFGTDSNNPGGWGSGIASFWQYLFPAAPDSTQQQSTASQQPEPSNNDSTKSSSVAQEAQHPPAAAPEVQDAVVPFGDPSPRLHGTGNETLDKDIATESAAQAAADGSARAVAASAASSAVAAGATNNNTEVISHAEAHAESSASSWSWSPETGNITHQAKSEAHATADSVYGTAKASAFADAFTDGLNSTAQSTAAVDGDRAKAVVQANASLRSLKSQEFAVPVDVPVAAVPYKADTGSTSNTQGPSHSNPADPASTAVITSQADPQKPKPQLSPQSAVGSNSAFAAVTNALSAAGQLVIGTAITPTRPAVDLPSTPPAGSGTTQCNVVANESGQQAIKCNKVIAGPALNRAAPTILLGGSNAQQFSAAEAPTDFEPSAVSSSPLPSPAAGTEAVNGTITDAAAPAENTPAAAVSPAATIAVSPAASAAAASPAGITAVSPAPAVLAASKTATSAASGAATTAVSPATKLTEVVAAIPSPRPIIKHTITIIHDPAITDAVTSAAANSVTSTAQDIATDTITGGGVDKAASSNSSSSATPAEPRSGLSLADYYDADDASGDLSQDVPPQIPANSSQVLKNDSRPSPLSSNSNSLLPAPSSSSPQAVASGPTAAPAVSPSPVIGPVVSRPAATPVVTAAPSVTPAAAEPTAEQPATSALSPAAIKPAAAAINSTPASAGNSLAPIYTHAPGSQSTSQQTAKSQAVATPPVSPSPPLSGSPSPTPAPMVSPSAILAGSPPSNPAASPSLTVAAPPPASPLVDSAASQAPPSAVSATPSPTVTPSSSDGSPPASSSSVSPAAASIVDTSAKNLFGTTWQSAPACQSLPNKRNSVQDATGRLWWWEDNHSCAYRAPAGNPLYYAGYTEVKWETSPPCQFTATQINAMADANGRAWGWISESSTNCKFVKSGANQSGAALMYLDIAKQ